MVVVGIIALLLAILVPAFNEVRKQARVAQCRSVLSSIQAGLEAFKSDHVVGGRYPPSEFTTALVANPHVVSQGLQPPQGAYFLVWGLAGADLLGTPGFIDVDGDGLWYGDTHANAPQPSGLYAMQGNVPLFQRAGPFVDVTKMQFPERVGSQFQLGVGGKAVLDSLVFLDPWGFPILYYRSNPVAQGNPPNVQIADSSLAINDAAFYYQYDNALFTSDPSDTFGPGIDLGGGTEHQIKYLGNPEDPNDLSGLPPGVTRPFARYIHNPAADNPAAPTLHRPHNAHSYLLTSPGPDALWGTIDDVTNFELNR